MKIYFRGKLFDTEAKGYIFYKNINFPNNMEVPFAAIGDSKTVYFGSGGDVNTNGSRDFIENSKDFIMMTIEEVFAKPLLIEFARNKENKIDNH